MSGFSFTNFSNFSVATKDKEESSNVRPPSERQYAFYMDLCKQRNIEPKAITEFSYDELSEKIKELRSFFPASDAQKNLITTKINNLNQLGVNIQAPDMSKLTGGKDGSASKLIESLINLEKDYKDKMPPSEKQLAYMVNMFLCPDVAFEEYEIAKRIPLENDNWRYMTPDEFAEEIKSKINSRQASQFIDKYKFAFSEWRATRIRPEQQRYIRTLEDRLVGKETAKIEWVIGNNGELEMKKIYNTSEDNNKIWRITEMQLMQFSVEDASKYIEILTQELARKESSSLEPVTSGDKDKEEDDEFEKLQTALHHLEAVAGYEVPELHEAISSLITDGFSSKEINEIKKQLHDFMLEIIKQDCIDLPGLVELIKDCSTLQSILLNVA